MKREECVIVGAGPCGIAAAIALKKIGIEPLIIEKGNVVNAIYHYPMHQTFFSTSEKLEIDHIPFLTVNRKPKRMEALIYYREVVKRNKLRIYRYETVTNVQKQDENFILHSDRQSYEARYVIIATGYYDHPNMMNIKGEELDKVNHYFKEAHPFFDMDVVVVGGKNSAIDAALELQQAGARVTVLYRGSEYSTSIKPWILPDFDSLVKNEEITMVFNAEVVEITNDYVIYEGEDGKKQIRNDFVFAMTGYHPDHSFLKKIGVAIDEETGRPFFNSNTMETNVDKLFIAGVIAAGNNANEIFIENGRFHGNLIAKAIKDKQ